MTVLMRQFVRNVVFFLMGGLVGYHVGRYVVSAPMIVSVEREARNQRLENRTTPGIEWPDEIHMNGKDKGASK